MEPFLIIILLALGLLLIFIEIFFIPGTTFIGILGLVLAGVGIYFAYKDYGTALGSVAFAITVIAVFVALYSGFKKGAWDKLSHKSTITGRVNIQDVIDVKPGDKGKAVSAIRPMGKARFGKFIVEVSSINQFINAGTAVEVVKTTSDRIFVKVAEQVQSDENQETKI